MGHPNPQVMGRCRCHCTPRSVLSLTRPTWSCLSPLISRSSFFTSTNPSLGLRPCCFSLASCSCGLMTALVATGGPVFGKWMWVLLGLSVGQSGLAMILVALRVYDVRQSGKSWRWDLIFVSLATVSTAAQRPPEGY